MDPCPIGLDLDDPLAAFWVAQLWQAHGKADAPLRWTASLGSPSPGLRQRLSRVARSLTAVEFLDAQVAAQSGDDANEAQPEIWLGGPNGLAMQPGGMVLGLNAPEAKQCAPAHHQALLRTVALWATRFELRWLLICLRTGSAGRNFVAPAEARSLERAVERQWPELAGKISIRVEAGANIVSELELHASFAGAPGVERLRAGLRDVSASPAWRAHLSLTGAEFLPQHALDRPQLFIDAGRLDALGPLAVLRAQYDPAALGAARLLEFAASVAAPHVRETRE